MIAEAGTENLEEMCLLLQELFGMEQDFAGAANRDKQRAGLRLILEHPERGQLLLLKRGDKVAGMVNLVFAFSTFEGGPVIILEDFIVAADERGQGSGRFSWTALLLTPRSMVFCGSPCWPMRRTRGRCIFMKLRVMSTLI